MSRSSSSGAGAAGASSAALPFLQCDANGRFFLQPEALKLISSIKGKICPVVVAGPYRTGKSTLLNLLLDRNVKSGAGFAVGGTVQACTKGMWLWGQPLVIGDCTYLFIDSEGLGSVDQHATFDTQIFSLSILLSSLFVLNTQGTINESALEQLELVVQMTDRIRVKEDKKLANGGEQSLASLAHFFPSFLWVLRDFTLELQNTRGESISSNEYLEDSLRPVAIGTNSKKGAAEKNRIRSAIATVFPQRQCITMVRPVTEERDLQRVSTLGAAALRGDFRTQIEHLKTLIPQLAQPKSVEGVQLNGRAFVALAQNYIQAINSGGIPTIRTAFQSVQEIQGREAMDAALELTQAALRDNIEARGDNFVFADEALESTLAGIQASALQLINEQALGSASDLLELTDQFTKKHLNVIFSAARATNVHRAEKSCRTTVESLWEESGIEAHLPAYESYKQLNTDVSGFWAQYLKLTKNQGSKALQLEVGRAFLDQKREVIFKSLFERLHVSAAAIATATKANEANQKVIAGLNHDLLKVQQEQAIASKGFQLELAASQKDAAKLQKELTEVDQRARAGAVELAQLHQQANQQSRAADANLHAAQSKLEALQAKVDATQSKLESSQSKLSAAQSGKAEVEAELTRVTKEKSKIEKALAAATSEVTATASGATKQVTQLQNELRGTQAELADKSLELSTKETALATLQAKFSSFQQSLKQEGADRDREFKTRDDAIKAKDKQIKALEKEAAEAEVLSQQVHDQVDAQAREIQMLQRQLEHAQQRQQVPVASASNPLGLPAPTAGPLVSRKSVIPSSFSKGAAAAGKRKSSPVVEEDAADYEMGDGGADAEDDDVHSDSESVAARRSSFVAGAAAAGHPSSQQPLRDPSSLSIAQLKSWLTSLDVEFPQKALPKQSYIDLVYTSLGDTIEQAFPRGQAKKKGKK